MTDSELREWLNADLQKFEQLTSTASKILQALLVANKVHCLSCSGRTKDRESVHEKIKRKGYSDPKKQLTDISGIRVIVYFESQVEVVSEIIKKSFSIDHKRSSNKDDALSIDQNGYRSVHFICKLGKARAKLPEHSHLCGLQFEIQLRTVLQHAWAELAHDRNYKFSAKLPRTIERQLFLYAGMLEIADRGFSELAAKIDAYVSEVRAKTEARRYDMGLDSVSLEQFVQSWCKETGIFLETLNDKDASSRLAIELKDYGLASVDELRQIIPKKYAEFAKELAYRTTIYGLVRDWMILHDYKRYRDSAWKQKWSGFSAESDDANDIAFFNTVVGAQATREILRIFGRQASDDFVDEPEV